MLRFGLIVTAVLTLVVVLLVVAVLRLWFGPNTVTMLERHVEQQLPALQLEQVSGTLHDGIRIEQLQWQTGSQIWTVDELALRPDWSCFAYLQLCLKSVSAARVSVSEPAAAPVSVGQAIELPEIVLPEIELPEIELPLPVSLSLDRLQIETLDLRALGVADLATQVRLGLHWSGSKLQIKALRFDYQDWRPQLSGALRLEQSYPLNAELRLMKKNALSNANERVADIEVQGDLPALRLRINMRDPMPLTARVETNLLDRQLPWRLNAELGQAFVFDVPQPRPMHFEVQKIRVTAQGAATRGSASLAAQLASDLWQEPQALTASIDFDPDHLLLKELQLALPEQGLLSVAGQLDALLPSRSPSLNQLPLGPHLQISWDNLRVNIFEPSLPKPLTISGQAQVSGEWHDELNSLSVSELTTVGDYGDHKLDLSLSMGWSQAEHLSVNSLKLAVADNQLQLSERWSWGAPSRWRLKLENLQQLHPQARGSVKGQLDVKLQHEGHTATLNLRGQQLGFDSLSAQDVDLNGTVSIARQLNVKLQANDLAVGDTTWQRLDLALEGDWKNARLNVSANETAIANIKGQCEAVLPSLNATGHSLSLVCEKASIALNDAWQLPRWQLSSPVSLVWQEGLQKQEKQEKQEKQDSQPAQFSISPFCLVADKARLCSDKDVVYQPDKMDVELTAEQLPLSWLKPWLNPQVAIDGYAAGRIRIIAGDGANGGANDGANDGAGDGENDGQQKLSARLTSDAIRLLVQRSEENVEFALTGTELTLHGDAAGIQADFVSSSANGGNVLGDLAIAAEKTLNKATKERPRKLSGQLVLTRIPLVTIMPLFDEFRLLEGELGGKLLIKGDVSKPLLYGEVNIDQGRADIIGLPWLIDDANINVAVDASQLSYQGNARLGEGHVGVNGQLNWNAQGTAGTMRISGRDIHYQPMPRANIWIDPDLNISWQGDALSLGGKITLPKAFVVMQALPKNSIAVSSDTVVIGAEQAASQPWQLFANVDVVLGEVVKFRGFGLETFLDGALTITSAPQTPWQGRGLITLREGSYRAYGQNLAIRNGSLIFSGPLENPSIQVEAIRADIEPPVVAGVRADGTLQDPTVTVFSSPAMAEQRVLYLLLTGQMPESGSGEISSTALASQAALAYGFSKGESAASSVANKLGIYDFQLSAVEGEQGPTVQLGGYINPRLHLRYGVSTFDNVNELTLRYRLRANLFVEAVSSAANALDLLWTFQLDK